MNPRPAPLIERRQSRPSERPTLRPAVPPARATVEVLREDTIDAVIAALRATGGATVRIVVPRDARALNRPEHVRFLAGFLRREGCQAIIATDDAVLAELAAAGGIPTEPLGHGAEARADAPAGRALPDLP
ncbi:MAG: hypothetical protein FJ029_06630, partial [Actinobacteria bacterium]|nr:hypothetical protein [Actinomycetota bacterium]